VAAADDEHVAALAGRTRGLRMGMGCSGGAHGRAQRRREAPIGTLRSSHVTPGAKAFPAAARFAPPHAPSVQIRAAGGRNCGLSMFDLVFRCRERMALVYGRVAPGPLAGARFAVPSPPPALPTGKPRRPGELARSRNGVSVRPMPRRV
jgi:hypothetical protein